MRVKAFVTLRPGLLRFFSSFRWKLWKARSPSRRPWHPSLPQPSNRLGRLQTFLWFFNRNEKETEHLEKPPPHRPVKKHRRSRITPVYNRRRRISKKDKEDEAACRVFEHDLVQMIVEEGRIKDLTDIEDLLLCWRNLNNTVFIDLVSRFYRDLCQDLFSDDSDKDDNDLHGGDQR